MAVTAAVPTAARARPLALLWACVRRDWTIARSYRLPFVLDLVQSLTGVVLFYFLGSLVDDSGAAGPAASSPALAAGYFAFAVVGLLLLDIVGTSLTAFSDRLRADQTTGTLEALLVSPAPPWLVALGGAGYQLLYSAAKACLSLAVAMGLLGLRLHATPVAALMAAVGLAAAVALFSSLGVAFAAFTVVFKRGVSLVGLATTALALLGGVYFPVTLLPAPLRALAGLLPFTWAVDVLRETLLLGRLPLARLGVLVGAAAVLAPLSCRLFDRAVAQARRTGTLAQY